MNDQTRSAVPGVEVSKATRRGFLAHAGVAVAGTGALTAVLAEFAATIRRMMLVGFHDRINGHANRIRVLDRFFTCAKSNTPVLNHGSAALSGLPGPG